MNNKIERHHQPKSWGAELLRFTVFTDPSFQVMEQNWWADLIGDEPSTQNIQPKEGLRIESGPFAKGKLALSISPSRIDWRFTVEDNESLEDFSRPWVLGTLDEAMGLFEELMFRWFEMNPDLSSNRLAIGAVLLQSIENAVEGYDRLSNEYLSFKIDSGDVSDFLYQINRPRPSGTGIKDLKINRLSRWSVTVVKQLRIGIVPYIPQQELGSSFHCRLELDVNTSQDYGNAFTQPQIPAVLRELIDLSIEIAQDGDKP